MHLSSMRFSADESKNPGKFKKLKKKRARLQEQWLQQISTEENVEHTDDQHILRMIEKTHDRIHQLAGFIPSCSRTKEVQPNKNYCIKIATNERSKLAYYSIARIKKRERSIMKRLESQDATHELMYEHSNSEEIAEIIHRELTKIFANEKALQEHAEDCIRRSDELWEKEDPEFEYRKEYADQSIEGYVGDFFDDRESA